MTLLETKGSYLYKIFSAITLRLKYIYIKTDEDACIFLTLGVHAQRESVILSVHLSFCLSVTMFSATTLSKKPYQQVHCHTGLILKMVIFVKVLRSKVMA